MAQRGRKSLSPDRGVTEAEFPKEGEFPASIVPYGTVISNSLGGREIKSSFPHVVA